MLSRARRPSPEAYGLGDVRNSASGKDGGTPTVAAKHTTEHPPMSQRAATVTSLPMAFEIVKAMQAQGLDWGEAPQRAACQREMTSLG